MTIIAQTSAFEPVLGSYIGPDSKEIWSRLIRISLKHDSEDKLISRQKHYTVNNIAIRSQIFSARSHFLTKLSSISMHVQDRVRVRIIERINALTDLENWDDDDTALRTQSIDSFLKFMVLVNPTRPPSFGVSISGNLIASWNKSDEYLTIDFQEGNSILWSVAMWNIDTREREAGTTSITSIIDVLSRFNYKRWTHE